MIYSLTQFKNIQPKEAYCMASERLEKQIQFIVEIDKLKQIYRQTYLMNGSRRENSVEHSWHLALMTVLLAEYSPSESLDLFRVLKMVLIHDLVEIDAGDTLCYDEKARRSQKSRELMAADRIFNLLPPDQAGEMRALWDEFEASLTPEAGFARAIDRMQPVLHNYYTRGAAWRKHGVTRDQVVARNRKIEKAAPEIWDYIHALIERAVEKDYLLP